MEMSRITLFISKAGRITKPCFPILTTPFITNAQLFAHQSFWGHAHYHLDVESLQQ